jgi:hypothetical protein
MNPLFKLKYGPMPTKQPGISAKPSKKINVNNPNAKLSTRKIGGWTGYFITVNGEEKQVSKHKYYTHPSNVRKLLSISKSGHATPEDKALVNYYKKLADSKVEYKIPGVSSTINLDPKYTEPPKPDPHSQPVKMNIGKSELQQSQEPKVVSRAPESTPDVTATDAKTEPESQQPTDNSDSPDNNETTSNKE